MHEGYASLLLQILLTVLPFPYPGMHSTIVVQGQPSPPTPKFCPPTVLLPPRPSSLVRSPALTFLFCRLLPPPLIQRFAKNEAGLLSHVCPAAPQRTLYCPHPGSPHFNLPPLSLALSFAISPTRSISLSFSLFLFPCHLWWPHVSSLTRVGPLAASLPLPCPLAAHLRSDAAPHQVRDGADLCYTDVWPPLARLGRSSRRLAPPARPSPCCSCCPRVSPAHAKVSMPAPLKAPRSGAGT